MTLRTTLVFSLLSCALSAAAQIRVPETASPHALEIMFSWSGDRTNAPPSGCGCFWMQGGTVEANAFFVRNISIIAEVNGERANHINAAGENLGLVSYLFGPRYTLVRTRELGTFAQFLVGGVHGSLALFPNPNGSQVTPDAFAFAAGGGVNMFLTHRLGIRPFEIEYAQTRFPNDGNNLQNHLRLSAGLVFRIGGQR